MEDQQKHFRAALTYLRRSNRVIKLIKIVATAGGAALLAFSSWKLSEGSGQAPVYVHVLFWIGLIVTVLGSLILTFLDDTTADILADNLKLSTDKDTLVDNIDYADEFVDYLLKRVSLNSQIREILETAVTDGVGADPKLDGFLQSILGLLVERKLKLFGIEDESWNFAVYVYDRAGDNLVCRACMRSTELADDYEHRVWPNGDGHVGLTFDRGRELIFADATRDELKPVIGAKGENVRDEDDELYKSLAAIPISANGKDVAGILIATSSTIGRFKTEADRDEKDWDREDVLREVAAQLAIIFELHHYSTRDQGDQNE